LIFTFYFFFVRCILIMSIALSPSSHSQFHSSLVMIAMNNHIIIVTMMMLILRQMIHPCTDKEQMMLRRSNE